VAAWLEDWKGHFAVSWPRHLDKWTSKNCKNWSI